MSPRAHVPDIFQFGVTGYYGRGPYSALRSFLLKSHLRALESYMYYGRPKLKLNSPKPQASSPRHSCVWIGGLLHIRSIQGTLRQRPVFMPPHSANILAGPQRIGGRTAPWTVFVREKIFRQQPGGEGKGFKDDAEKKHRPCLSLRCRVSPSFLSIASIDREYSLMPRAAVINVSCNRSGLLNR
jgi:hypothetical protein